MSNRNAIILTLGGIAMLLAGIAIGAWLRPRVEPALPPSDRFIADRMAECTQTLRLHEVAVEDGNTHAEDLLRGDLAACHVLVSRFPDRIPDRDRDTAERITAAARSAASPDE